MHQDSRIRVLYVTSTARVGGAERRALNLARYTDPSRFVPSFLTLEGEGELLDEIDQAGIPHEAWTLRGPFQPRLLARMQRLLKRERIDLVHPYGLRAELLVRGPASRSGARVISSICSVDPWRRWYHTALDRATAGGVTAWISNSEAGKRAALARERMNPKRVFVVPTGIPDRPPADEAAKRRAREQLGLAPAEGPVLAVVANLRRAKGHEELVEAVGKLRSRWPGIVCLCAGRDDSGGRIPRLIERRGLQDAFRLTGFMREPAVAYDAADLAVLPSHWEGMPSAVIEAMRAALPIIATDVGGLPELIESGTHGRLVPAGDALALTGAIESALEPSSASAAWGRAARQRFEAHFTVETMARRTWEIQERVHSLSRDRNL